MIVIPVVDLVGGQVVHARKGNRDAYRPIVSPLSPTSDPVDVVGGLLALHPFTTLYVADLDSILGRGDNRGALRRLRTAFPALQLWIDNGAHDSTALAALLDEDLGVPVVGSESQRDGALVAAHRGSDRVILSLDFRKDLFLGCRTVLESPDTWPNRVIVMTLARVGGEAGPDFDRLRAIRTVAGGRAVFAAGGLRDGRDLAECKALGCAGALVATALHDGRLSGSDLEAYRRA
jgi:phosphoribosylformimino-5-aminoimidazole carboxamide ribotide isomerase